MGHRIDASLAVAAFRLLHRRVVMGYRIARTASFHIARTDDAIINFLPSSAQINRDLISEKSSTTTVFLSMACLCGGRQVARLPLDGDSDSDELAAAWLAARATRPAATPGAVGQRQRHFRQAAYFRDRQFS